MYSGSGTPAKDLDAQQSINCEQYVAGATLLIGDTVFLDPATGLVNKTLVLADYDSNVGVVVGGRSTFGVVLQNDIDIGEQAALINQEVLVAWGGIVKCLSDAAITRGDRVAAATVTTAGRVKTSVATNFVLGVALTTVAGPGLVVRVLLGLTHTAMT